MSSTDIVSSDVSKRICAHMNDDHGLSVYAMAKSLLPSNNNNITQARLKSVSADGCTIAAVTCTGDVCNMHTLVYPFDPPLKSSAECRSRMVYIHRKVCSPDIIKQLTKPLSIAILLAVAFLCYVALVPEKVSSWIASSELGTMLCFGNPKLFVKFVVGALYFTVIAHSLEAAYTLYCSKTKLKLSTGTSLQWAILVTLVGYPVFSDFNDLVQHVQPGGNKSH